MKKTIMMLIVVSLLSGSCLSKNNENSLEVTLKNQTDIELVDQYVELDLNKTNIEGLAGKVNFIVRIGDKEIPSQKSGENKIGFVTDFSPNEEKIVLVEYGQNVKPQDYTNRAYAEIAMKVDAEYKDGQYTGGRFQTFDYIKIPEGHTDHNALFKYEGLGLESDKVAYRMYIDWRNRIDIFGKKTTDMILYKVGLNDLESENEKYHEMNDWGMDIFKVGSTLGIGTYAMYTDDGFVSVETRDSVIVEIIENGPVKATAQINYYGWKVNDETYDLTAKLSSLAGSRLIETELEITNNPKSLITGIAKYENTQFIKSDMANGWNYIGLYGKQALSGDDLGIAVLYNTNSLIEQTEDEENYIVELQPDNGKVKYYFCAAWHQEPDGIKSKEEFYQYLNKVVKSLNNPITLKY